MDHTHRLCGLHGMGAAAWRTATIMVAPLCMPTNVHITRYGVEKLQSKQRNQNEEEIVQDTQAHTPTHAQKEDSARQARRRQCPAAELRCRLTGAA